MSKKYHQNSQAFLCRWRLSSDDYCFIKIYSNKSIYVKNITKIVRLFCAAGAGVLMTIVSLRYILIRAFMSKISPK